MKKLSDIVSIFGGLLAVVSVLVTSVLSTVQSIDPANLALLLIGGMFSGFLICLAGFGLAEFGKQSKATDYAA